MSYFVVDPFAKIKRADAHFNELKARIGEFWQENPYRIVHYADTTLGRMGPAILAERGIPSDWPLIIGDIIHNLRASLDVALNAAVAEDRRGEARAHIYAVPAEKYSTGIPNVKGLPDLLQEQLVAIQPYNTGDFTLRHIHDLDIADKHCGILIAAANTAVQNYRGDGHGSDFSFSGLKATFKPIQCSELGIYPLGFSVPIGTKLEIEPDVHLTSEIVLSNFKSLEGVEVVTLLGRFFQATDAFVKLFV